MTKFLIYLDKPTDEALERIKRKWPNGYVHQEKSIFLTDDENRLTQDIADDAGISAECPGVVIEVAYLSGFSSQKLVEWVGKN